MGNSQSCATKGALLLVAAANGDLAVAQELLKRDPKAASYRNFKDRTSPLIQAAARGHFELVQAILETAVMHEGPEKARRHCIDHVNYKKQSALTVACKYGHPECVEYLICNGADPLIQDERRHNTCLHFAALYGRSECIQKLLGSRATYRHQGRYYPIAQLPCVDDDDMTSVSFIDRHNGWGLTALHLAVFQGSVSTVRALLRQGTALEALITVARIENSPIRCAVGSNALHIAAFTGNIVMAKVLLEAQEGHPGLELRSQVNSAGLKPQDYAQRARHPVLVHLLDERLPVTLLRQIWMNYSMDQSLPPRHQTLGALLLKLKLMFNLEVISIDQNIAALATEAEVTPPPVVKGKVRLTEAMSLKLQWSRRREEISVLLATVTGLHDQLTSLCSHGNEPPRQSQSQAWPAGRCTGQEPVLDFILSTLITPRTVSALLHAAKKVVATSLGRPTTASAHEGPSADTEVSHGIALLTTAMRAVETCLSAAQHLSNGIPEIPVTSSTPVQAANEAAPDPSTASPFPAGGEAPASAPTHPRPLVPQTLSALLEAHTHPESQAALGNRSDPTITSSFALHWSAHLHTLLAQLQWDIGMQRHRRRRHAQQHLVAALAVGNGTATAAAPAAAVSPGNVGATRTAGTEAAAAALGSVRTGCGIEPQSANSLTVANVQEGTSPSTPTAAIELPDREAGSLASGLPGLVVRVMSGAECTVAPETMDSPQLQHRNSSNLLGVGTSAYHAPALWSLANQPGAEVAGGVAGLGSCVEISGQDDEEGVEGVEAGEDEAESVAGDESVVSSAWSHGEHGVCAICMDLPVAVLVAGCHHGLCMNCAFQLCVKGRELPSCPFCRKKIAGFEAKATVFNTAESVSALTTQT